MDELLTIQEFAEIVGLKPQGIYKQAANENSRLYPFVVYYRGKRYIKKEALKEIYQIEQPIKPQKATETTESKQPEQPEEKQNNPQEENADNPAALIEYLKEQLKTRDREIAELHRLLFNQQELHAKDKALLLEYQTKERQEAPPPPTSQDIIEHTTIIEEQPPQKVQEEKKKRGWLYRLFFGED